MRLERDFESNSPEASLFRAPEPISPFQTEARLFVPRTEVVLFSRTAKEDPKIPDQSSETNQTVEPIRTKTGGDWEPFSEGTDPNHQFRNLYGGNYAQDMELNRKKVEQLISVSALQGVVVLQSLPQTRGRGIDINPDGSTTSKKNLFWGEKPEDKENPYGKVTRTPEGWKIEVCDQRIRDELSEKYSGEHLKKKFAESFNSYLREGILEAIVKEKLSFKEGVLRRIKTILSIAPLLASSTTLIVEGYTNLETLLMTITTALIAYLMIYNPGMNLTTVVVDKVSHSNDKYQRNLTSFYEIFMPLLEVDRVLRGFAFANIKGRNLVRLRPDEAETSAR